MERLTDEQAAAIGAVLETADGGCYVCAGRLADEMAEIWPEHDWRALVNDPDHDAVSGRARARGYQMVEKKWDPGEIKGGAVVYGPDDAA